MNDAYQTYQAAVTKARKEQEEEQQPRMERNEKGDDDDKCDDYRNHPDVIQAAKHFNQVREQAVQARWELIVHRQAVGFIVNNHSYVMKQYPIAEAIPIVITPKDDNDGDGGLQQQPNDKKKKNQQKFGDQLDWWQRIGRWRWWCVYFSPFFWFCSLYSNECLRHSSTGLFSEPRTLA